MNISFNTKIPMMYDFLKIITAKYNNIDFINRNTAGGLNAAKRTINAIEYICVNAGLFLTESPGDN